MHKIKHCRIIEREAPRLNLVSRSVSTRKGVGKRLRAAKIAIQPPSYGAAQVQSIFKEREKGLAESAIARCSIGLF